MDIKSVYDIAGRAMAAQLVRLNTVASNLANAGSTTGDPKTTYKPLKRRWGNGRYAWSFQAVSK